METAVPRLGMLLPLLFLAGFGIFFGLIHATRNRRFGTAIFGTIGALMFFAVASIAAYQLVSRPPSVATPQATYRYPPAPRVPPRMIVLPDDGEHRLAEAPLNDLESAPLPSETNDDPKTPPSTADREQRPAWVDAPTGRVGKPYRTHVSWVDAPTGRDGQVYRTRVAVGDYATREECERNLPDALRQAVGRYVDLLIGPGAGWRIMARLPLPYIHEQIVKAEWEEHPDASFGEMVRLHELLEFDQRVNTYLRDLHEQALVAERLKYTTVAAGVVFGLLATVFGYLKLDTLTRGYYTGRLRLAAAAAILAIVASLLVGR